MEVAETKTVPKLNALHRIIGQSLRVKVHILNHALSDDTASMEKVEKAMAKNMLVLWEEVANYEKLITAQQLAQASGQQSE